MSENTVNDHDTPAADALAAGDAPVADPVEALRQEKDALQDRLLRSVAEFDNYRKRIDRERREYAESAAADILADLLPIMGDLERALQAPATGDAEAYRKGVELIYRQMNDFLRKRGVRPIDAVGADFDPRYHQAVAQEASPDHREGEVIEELRRGYMLGDRLLQPAMVKVARS